MQGETDAGRMGRGQGPGPMAGLHAQQIQQETTVTLIAVAALAAGAASLLGFWLAGRIVRPLVAAGAGGRCRWPTASSTPAPAWRRGPTRSDRSGRSFDAMAAELEAAEGARRRFLQDAAHELKTPLAVIDATTSAVLDGVYAHDDRHLETIRDQSRLLARIVDDLRTVSLADAGVLPLRREPSRSERLLASVARDMASRASGRGVSLEAAEPSAAHRQRGPDRLRQALGALVDNAIRHTPAGGWIRLEGRAGGEFVGRARRRRLRAGDRARGPAARLRPLLPGDPARDRATGSSGLGLAIVRAVVERHGGRVTATNEPGAGARFEVDCRRLTAA